MFSGSNHLKDDTLQDSLVGHLAGLVMAEVEQGDGGPVGIPAGQDGELSQAQLGLQRARAVVEESETFSYPEMSTEKGKTQSLVDVGGS